MKNLIYLIALIFGISCNAQTYPLRTYGPKPQNSYLKDTNNELPAYQGTWKGNWDTKTFYLYIYKVENKYKATLKYSIDVLVAKFKVVDPNGNILFDNTNLTNDNAKIIGGNFKKSNGKYSMSYLDNDLCGMMGFIEINFTDATKTQLNWKFNEGSNLITASCPYYNLPFPQPLPKTIILTKQ